MAFESCVTHPARDWFFQIRLDYYGITGENHCSAALLYIMEFATNGVLQQMEKDGTPGDPWISVTKQQLSNSLIRLFSPRTIYDSLADLCGLGFISEREQAEVCGTKQYLLHYDKVSAAVMEWSGSDDGRKSRSVFHGYSASAAEDCGPRRQNCTWAKLHVGKIAYDTWAKLPTIRGQNCLHTYKEEEYMKEQGEEQKGQIFPSELQSESQNQTAPRFESQSTLYDLQLSENVHVFVKNAYRQSRGSRLPNADLKRYGDPIANLEASIGPEEFRTALWNYLGSADDWKRKQKWPIALFLKSYASYLPDTAQWPKTPPAIQSPILPPSSAASEPPTAASCHKVLSETSEDARGKNENNCLTFVHRWDTVNSMRPVGRLLADTMRLLERAAANRDFAENFDEICAAAGRLIDAGQPTKFSWLFLTGSGIPNWSGLLQGKFDFLMQGSQGRMNSIDRMIAEAERKERELAGSAS